MKTFEQTSMCVTLILKNLDTGEFLMDYDDDYGEPRLAEFELKNEKNLLGEIVDFVEEKGLNLVSYAKLSDISHVQYIYKNDTPGTLENELVILAFVENNQKSELLGCPEHKFLEAVKSSSVLDEIEKAIVLGWASEK